MNNFPLVTVLMPVYNGEKYLKEAIDSILSQTYTNFEFLIINDGSIDSSENIILSYKDQRIRYVKNESNLKLIATLNKGINLSNGDFIVRLDADDIAHEERITKQVCFLQNNPEYGMVGSWCRVINSEKTINYHTDHNDLIFAMAIYCPFIHPSITIRKSVLLNNQLQFDYNFMHAEDYELWTRIINVAKVANIPEFLTYYREHENQISTVFQNEQIKMASEIKINYLNKLQLKYNVDLRPLFGLNSFPQNDIKSIADYFNLIFEINEINLIFKSSSFRRFLINEFKNFVLEEKQINIFNYNYLNKLKISKEVSFTLKQKINFLFRSIKRI